MKNNQKITIFIISTILFCTELKAQSFENTVILIEESYKYGDLETVKEYFLLEPIEKDSTFNNKNILLFDKKYKLYRFEISYFYLNCCKVEKKEFGFINEKGDADYSSFMKKSYNKRVENKKLTVSKIKMEYCKCASYFKIPEIICTPKQIISNQKITKKERKELKANLENIYKVHLISTLE